MSRTSSAEPGSPVSRRRWLELRLTVPTILEDELAGAIGATSLGVETTAAGEGMSTLSVYLGTDREVEAVRSSLASLLRSFGAGPGIGGASVRPVEDGGWVESYQASLRPLPLGRRFVVVPGTDVGPADPGRTKIHLVPGRAFGTGEHPTTRLCAAALEFRVRPGERWLDVGTGSGILAVVAARTGAARVDAVDTDPDAVEVAQEVVTVNGVAGQVRVAAGTAAGYPDESFDGAVANVSEAYLLADSRHLARVLRPDGLVVASGFLESDHPAVFAAMEAAGFAVEERDREGPWVCVAARRAR